MILICPDFMPDGLTAEEQRLYDYPREGNTAAFREDNRALFLLLANHVASAYDEAFKSHRQSEEGVVAWKSLLSQYEGGGQEENRLNRANHHVKTLAYKAYNGMSFHDYAMKMSSAKARSTTSKKQT